MTAENYLLQIKKYWDKFLKSKYRIKELDEKKGLSAIVLDQVKVKQSPTTDSLINLIQAIEDEKRKCNEYYDKYINLFVEASGKINKLDNRIYAEILIRKYLNFETEEEIAKQMFFSQQHINRQRKEALKAFQKHLDESDV